MNLAQVCPGDEVTCNVKGREFRATVVEKVDTGLKITPPHGVTYHHVTARQVRKRHPQQKATS